MSSAARTRQCARDSTNNQQKEDARSVPPVPQLIMEITSGYYVQQLQPISLSASALSFGAGRGPKIYCPSIQNSPMLRWSLCLRSWCRGGKMRQQFWLTVVIWHGPALLLATYGQPPHPHISVFEASFPGSHMVDLPYRISMPSCSAPI